MDTSSGRVPAPSLVAINAIREARSSALKSTHKAILYAIASRLNAKKTAKLPQLAGLHAVAWSSYQRLAGDAGVSRSTCIEAVKALVRAGFLLKGSKKTDRGLNNIYAINIPALVRISRKSIGENLEKEDMTPTPSTVRSKNEPSHPSPPRPRSPEYMDVSYQEYMERFADQNVTPLHAFLPSLARKTA